MKKPQGFGCLESLPYIPVSLFKKFDLISSPEENIVKCMHSSGTSGFPSKIYLDKVNSYNQKKSLSYIFSNTIPHNRPFLGIVDSNTVVNSNINASFNARNAGVIGFSQLCRKPTYLLNSNLRFDLDLLSNLFEITLGQPTILYGFTSVIWKALSDLSLSSSMKQKLDQCTLIHGGGWKNLQSINVSSQDFKDQIYEKLRFLKSLIIRMIEQTGSIL